MGEGTKDKRGIGGKKGSSGMGWKGCCNNAISRVQEGGVVFVERHKRWVGTTQHEGRKQILRKNKSLSCGASEERDWAVVKGAG